MHPNQKRLREAYAAFDRGDLDAVTTDWAHGIVWHIQGTTPLAGDKQGAQEVLAFLGELMRVTDATFRLDPMKFFADDEYAVVLCQNSMTIADHDIRGLVAHVYRFDTDGRVAEGWFPGENALEIEAALKSAYTTAHL
jgi:hypothetical protein